MPDLVSKETFRWIADYAVGVAEIDHEHQGLFALAEQLHLAIRAGKGSDVLECLLHELVTYTCEHFAHEEGLMERIQYPYLRDHCREHEELRKAVDDMNSRAALGETSLAVELMQFLMDWLKCHTTTSDRRIGSYMRKRGLVP